MIVWILHHPRHHHIIVHYVVQKGTDAANSSWACSLQASPLMTGRLMPESQTCFCSMPYRMATK